MGLPVSYRPVVALSPPVLESDNFWPFDVLKDFCFHPSSLDPGLSYMKTGSFAQKQNFVENDLATRFALQAFPLDDLPLLDAVLLPGVCYNRKCHNPFNLNGKFPF